MKAIFELLGNDKRYEAMQKAGISNAKKYDWDHVAQQWNDYFFQEFENKTANRQSLYKHLYEREDIITLKYLVNKVDSDPEWSHKINSEYSYIDDQDKYRTKYQHILFKVIHTLHR